MKPILKSCDLFGNKFYFTVLKNESYKTTFGGITSIVCISIIAVFTFLFGQDFFTKKNPKIIQQTEIPDDYLPPYKLSPDTIVIPWRFSNNDGDQVDYSGIIYPILTYYEYITNSSGTIMTVEQKMTLTTCDEKISQVPEFNKKFNISQYFCFDWKEGNFSLGGYWDGNYTNQFQIDIAFCPDGGEFANEKNCTSLDKVYSFLNDELMVFFDMLYPTFYFSPDSIEDPVKLSYKNYYFALSLNNWRIDRIFFSYISLYDDLGWIMKDIKLKEKHGVVDIKSDFYFFDDKKYGLPGTASIFYSAVFYAQKPYQKYYRSFMKLQDLGAIIGGFIKIILLFGYFLTYTNNIVSKNNEIWAHFFIFEKNMKNRNEIINSVNHNKKGQGQQKDLSQIQLKSAKTKEDPKSPSVLFQTDFAYKKYDNNVQIQNLMTPNRNSNLKSVEPEILSLEIITKKINKKKINLNSPMKFDLNYEIRNMLCFSKKIKSRNQITYDILRQFFVNKFDVIYYLNNMNILENSLKIIFNKNQVDSFYFITKPNLNKIDVLDKTIIDLFKDNDSKLESVKSYFLEKYTNQTLDDTDMKLFNLITGE
jgi:hypothetical protein